MRVVVIGILLLVALTAVALGWQHLRYLKIRRQIVQDRQPMLYPSDTLHVVTFLRARPDSDLIEEVRKLRADLEGAGATLVYAGRAAFTALQSAQLPETDWEAVVLFSYPSRAHFDEVAGSAGYQTALGRFEQHYAHGLKRDPLLNAGLPLMLLGLRVVDVLRGVPSATPFVRAPEEQISALDRDRLGRLDDFRQLKSLSKDAVVVANLLKGGTKEQRAKDAVYGRRMFGMFARNACGPMHMGRALTLAGDAGYDQVALVYYPGVDYFIEMLESTFFNGIVGDKQLGDTLAVPTVPFGDRL